MIFTSKGEKVNEKDIYINNQRFDKNNKGGNDPMWLNKRSHHNKTSEVPWVVIMQC